MRELCFVYFEMRLIMNKKNIIFIVLVFAIVLVFSACSNNNLPDSDLISITVTYKETATEDDLKKYHNVYSADTEIALEKDNYYLIKVICTLNNQSSKILSLIDFVSYSNEYVLYEAGAIDIEPMYQIDPNTVESFEAYIYIDKTLDNEEKIKKALAEMKFSFSARSYDEPPPGAYGNTILFDGKFQT